MDRQLVHVLFFTTRLGGGGAEKLLLRIINNLDRQQFKLSLALCKGGGSYEEALAQDIAVYYLSWPQIPSISGSLLLSLLPLRRLINRIQPDVVCGVMDNANVLTVLATKNIAHKPKVILSVHNPITLKYNEPKTRLFNRLVFALIPYTYPDADSIITVSQGVARDLAALIPKTKDLLRVIYNPCVDEEVIAGGMETPPENLPPGSKLIIACGRLNPQKGFKDLISAMVEVRKVINAHLWIIGEGELRKKLTEQIESLGLGDAVRLLGFKANPYQYMAKADLFVLASLYEGFGNVIVEAMACGTAVVTTDCPFGPGEIIEDGVNGLLVKPGNKEALATGIIKVLSNPELQAQFINQGKIRAQDFETKKITQMYSQLFLSLSGVVYPP
jgi:glycosyltransferase involved in cell wall biosynthesis